MPDEAASNGDCTSQEKPAENSGNLRFLAYAARLRALSSISLKTGALRYLAFTSDFGEAFRPAVPSWLVNSAYGVSVVYIGGAVAEAGYTAHQQGKPWGEVKISIAEEATFQVLGSLLVPFLVIHTVVHRTAHSMKRRSFEVTRPLLAKWGPSGVGLACVPFLPVVVDKPCEHFVEELFSKYVRQSHANSEQFSRKHQHSSNLPNLQKIIQSYKSE